MSNLLPSELLDAGARCGQLLQERGHTVAVAEGAGGGLVSAALLAVPGASAYYLGGAVIYTRNALRGFINGKVKRPDELRGASEPWALHMAQCARTHLDATWGIGEGGAAGPGGNPYGDPSGYAWLAVSGPTEKAINIETGKDDRVENMVAFATAALELLAQELQAVEVA